MNTERRFVWIRGDLREVKDGWLWLFRLLRIGYDLSDHSQALTMVMRAMKTYHHACQMYLKA